MSWLRRLLGSGAPAGFTGELAPDEAVVAFAEVSGGGHLVATSRGLWVPDGDSGTRRVGWHLISKATWAPGGLSVVEAEEFGEAGSAVLLRDLPQVRFAIERPGKLPAAVHARVTGSILSRHHRDLPGGGAWFVQRKVVGAGVVLQVRPDAGTDLDAVREVAAEVAMRIEQAREVDDTL